MKKYAIFILSAIAMLAVACSKQEIKTFTDGNELFFQKFFENETFPGTGTADSTVVSFFFYPDGTQDVLAPLVINLSGMPLETDLDFNLRVVTELTTANNDEYTIDPSYTFRSVIPPGAADIRDTVYIKLHRSTRLDQLPGGVKLVVELVANDKVGLGQFERTRASIILGTSVSRPEWWNAEVTNTLLGTYTQKKFRTFLNEIDKNAEMNGQLIRERPDIARRLALQFKTWLSEQFPPILEDNGDIMEVAI